MPENITELSAIAIIFIFFLKEFFAYLKTKKVNGKNNSELGLLNFKLDNHVATITKEIFEIKEDVREIKRDMSELKNKKSSF